MYATTYHRPSSIDDAAALFAKGKEAKYLAGGHTLIPVMKQRLASPSDVIDLARIKELIGIESSGDTITVKAATPHCDVASSAAVQNAIPALAHLASVIGDPAVRHRGTIGGSLANNDPAADYPAAVLALGATIRTNKRSIGADECSARIRQSPTPVHWKPHFSNSRRDAGLVTRAPALSASWSRSVKA